MRLHYEFPLEVKGRAEHHDHLISGPGEPRACVRLVRVRAEERALRGVLEVQGDEEGGTPITSEWKIYSDCILHADLAYHFCLVWPGCCQTRFANTFSEPSSVTFF